MENTDTRSHFVVPMQITVKVENAEEAIALATAIAEYLPKVIKGVSLSNPPTVGIPAMVDNGVTLSDDEVSALGDLEASLGDDGDVQIP